MAAQDGGGTRFRAFLSYSHKDAATARWLHRRLETYRMPCRLVGSEGERGAVPPRLTPIFRDREELPAAGDLSSQVRAALAASETLVVICSPSSAASPWVAKEIALFHELHPERPILAAIVSGDPAQCFPALLTAGGAEPLAADLRPEGDGRRLGFLKLVAGLSGVGLDALVQRDAQRRIRRVTAVTVGALAAMLVMAVLTAFALDARQEAERQRAEAEGLVEFMLTDLRDRLKGVGRLDVLTAVNKRALDHYRGQDLDDLPVDSLERRARILHAMGEDDEKRGLIDRALLQFQEAARTTGALLAADPDHPERVYAHAQSEYWVGLIRWRTNDVDGAQASFQEYARLAGKLSEMDPAKADWLMEAGYAQSNLGTLLLRDKSQASNARPRFVAALRYLSAAARRKPNDPDILWDIADGHAWLADAHRAAKDHRAAFGERMRQAAILRRLLAEDPANMRFAKGWLSNELGLAQIELDTARYEEARRRLEKAHIRATEVARRDPANAELQNQRISIGLFLAKAMLKAAAPRKKAETESIRTLLSSCGAPSVRKDTELIEYCSILTSRFSGQAPVARPVISRAGTRLSSRWGIDFAAERRDIHQGE